MMPRNAGMLQGDAATIRRRLLGHLTYLRYGIALAPGEQRADRRIFTANERHIQPREVAAVLPRLCPSLLQLRKLVYTPGEGAVCDWLAWTRQEMAALVSPTPPLCWFAVRSQQPTPQVRVVVVERAEKQTPTAVIPLAELRATRQRGAGAVPCRPLGAVGHGEDAQEVTR